MELQFPFRHRPGQLAAAPESGEWPAIEIVAMRRHDVRNVVIIEQQVFTRPWSPSLYLSELAQSDTRSYVVARCKGKVVGYGGLMVVVGEGHITTIAVAPNWQGRHIGMALLYRLAGEARAKGAGALTLEVRMSNKAAQALYYQFGFAPAGVRKNYYAEVNEDALVMWAHDVASDDYAKRLAAIQQKLASGPGKVHT